MKPTPPRPVARHMPLTAAVVAATALALPPHLAAAPGAGPGTAPLATQPRQAGEGMVTSEGFEALAYASTLYIEVPMIGSLGSDVSGESVTQAIQAAAENPNIRHVVFMVDAEQGGLLDKDVVGIHQDVLEVHCIVKEAIAPAIFPVFYSDTIFIVEGGHIGGLPLHVFVPQGSDEVIAKMVGIFTNQLASAAESHGHNPDIVRAMIDQTKSLHYWRERGVIHVSNTAPASTGAVDDYEHITSLIGGATLTLDYDQAIKTELALPIEEFDAVWVGDQIGVANWAPANRFGFVANQIGRVNAELDPLRELLDAYNKQLPAINITRENRDNPQVQDLLEAKRNFERGVVAIEQITQALQGLYAVHPERHAYFPGDHGQTILENPEQWNEDVGTAQQHIGRARSGYNTLRNVFMQLDADPDQLDPIGDLLETIDGHIDGIRKNGNVHYWENVYEQPLPPDEHGVTYG